MKTSFLLLSFPLCETNIDVLFYSICHPQPPAALARRPCRPPRVVRGQSHAGQLDWGLHWLLLWFPPQGKTLLLCCCCSLFIHSPSSPFNLSLPKVMLRHPSYLFPDVIPLCLGQLAFTLSLLCFPQILRSKRPNSWDEIVCPWGAIWANKWQLRWDFSFSILSFHKRVCAATHKVCDFEARAHWEFCEPPLVEPQSLKEGFGLNVVEVVAV